MRFLSLFIASAIAFNVGSACAMNHTFSGNGQYHTATHTFFNSRRFIGGLLFGLSFLATMAFLIDRFVLNRNNPADGDADNSEDTDNFHHDRNIDVCRSSSIPKPPSIEGLNQNKPAQEEKLSSFERRRRDAIRRQKEERERKEQSFRRLGIPEWQIPYVRDAKRDGNVLKIQLKTVDQFSDNVISCVKEKQKALEEERKAKIAQIKSEELDQEVIKGKIREVENEYRNPVFNYSPNATCPSQVMRNALLMRDFFNSRGNQGQQQQILGNIKSAEHAQNYLTQLIQNNQPTSWLEPLDLIMRIQENNVDEIVTILDAGALSVRGDALPEVKLKLRDGGLPYAFHIFIINTGEAILSGEVGNACTRLKDNNKMPLQQRDLRRIRSSEETKCHYYLVAMERIGDQIRYYSIDTLRYNNHISNANDSFRDDYLCDMILHNRSNIDFQGYLRQYSESVIDQYITTELRRKKEKKEREKKEKELLQKKLAVEAKHKTDLKKKKLKKKEKQKKIDLVKAEFDKQADNKKKKIAEIKTKKK